MKNWKITLLILLLALAVAATGCKSRRGGGGGPPAVDNNGDGQENPVVIATFESRQLDRLPSGLFSAALGINSNRQVVGLSDNGTARELRGVMWIVAADGSPSAPLELAPLAGNSYSASYGINDAGIAVGESAKAADTVAVYWPAGSNTAVELILPASAGPAAAYAISGQDRIVGEARDAGGNMAAVLWLGAASAPTLLPLLPGGTTGASYGIDPSSTKIVGESENADGRMRAVVWSVAADGTAGDPVDLGTLSGHDRSIALGISSAGRIVGESESPAGETHAVIWAEGEASGYSIVDLGPAQMNSSAIAVSDSGLIAGWSETDGAPRAAAWHALSADLSNSSAILGGSGFSQAYGINNNDVVVGMAADQGFVAMPGP